MSNESIAMEEQRIFNDQEMVPLVPEQGEDEDDLNGTPSNFSASITARDWTIETLVGQMRKGRIDLSPRFQRRNAWLANRKSKLIESALLGFPIPQIVLAEKADQPGHFFVLDGKQRLLALRQFFVDGDAKEDEEFERLTLNGLEVLTSYNKQNIKTLDADPTALARLENHTIRTVVLSNWNSEKMLLSLFLRLNTGSVPLSPQELRQALIPGEFLGWLDETSGDMQPMRKLLGNDNPDRRMVDAELLLRFIAFKTGSIEYRGNLKQFLDDTSRQYEKSWKTRRSEAQEAAVELSKAIMEIRSMFGPREACRKFTEDHFERALNRAIFDVQTYSMSFAHVRAAAEDHHEDIVESFKNACRKDTSFIAAVSATTKTADAFITRHRAWAKILKEEAAVEYPLPAPLMRG